MSPGTLVPLLTEALHSRLDLFDDHHEGAIRLFNGFLEGFPGLAVDLYGRTLVLLNHAVTPAAIQGELRIAQEFYQSRLPWLQAMVVKSRHSGSTEERRGIILAGEALGDRVRENGVWYALDLRLNQDTSLYLDTRNLRLWAYRSLAGKTVLNAFAYTGSLGVAACAGGALRVVQVDHNKAFLKIAKRSYAMNGLCIDDADFICSNFFTQARHFRLTREVFDCVFLDPPFFSTTNEGTVDLTGHSQRLINKVRPLVANKGWLVVINNALFVSGADFLHALEGLCQDGYLTIDTLLPVPDDYIGYTQTRKGNLPADPAPFNHSTKIAILSVKRKD
jgi:23S rRNA (cytosine1962-C5)-methyltransferase